MSKQTYIDDLKSGLSQIDQKLAATRKHLEAGDGSATVEALKEISWLETRHKDLVDRLEKAESHHAEDWAEWHKGLREELDGVFDTLERLIVKNS